MADNDFPLPPISGGRVDVIKMRSRVIDTSKTQETLSGLRKQFWAALLISIGAGGAAGLSLGENTGVKEAIQAGAKIDGIKIARVGGTPDTMTPTETQSVASLVDELRGLRAQMEQMRHAAESQRVAERLKALETTQSANQDTLQGIDNAVGASAARLNDIDGRLTRLERAGADATPVGAISKTEQVSSAEKRGRRMAR